MRTFNTRLAQARELGGPVADVFSRIGVSIDPLQNTDEVFTKVARALSEYGTVAESAAVAAQALRRGGGRCSRRDARHRRRHRRDRPEDACVWTGHRRAGHRQDGGANTQMGLLGQGLSGLRQSLTTDFLSVLFDGFEDFDDEQMQEFIRTLRRSPTHGRGCGRGHPRHRRSDQVPPGHLRRCERCRRSCVHARADTAWGRQQAYRDSDAMIAGCANVAPPGTRSGRRRHGGSAGTMTAFARHLDIGKITVGAAPRCRSPNSPSGTH